MASAGPNSADTEQEALLRKKYGGLLPKKKALVSKDHERKFFDSADWALNKQQKGTGSPKPKGNEDLLPKLEPTPHNPLPARRPSSAQDPDSTAAEPGSDETSEPVA